MQQGESDTRSDRFTSLIFKADRKYWLIGVMAITIAFMALAAAGVGSKVETWTATTKITIGTLPTPEAIIGTSTDLVKPIETARDLVARIAGSQFQDQVFSGARQELAASQWRVAEGALRGIVLDDGLRLEAVAPSKEAAAALLQQAVVAIQKSHQQLMEPRLQFLREVRDVLQDALKRLNEEIKDGSIDRAHVSALAGENPSVGKRSLLENLVVYRTRIAALNFVERTIVPTEPQGGFVPIFDGPREANLTQRALLSGLGILFFAVLTTFLLQMRSGRK